MALFPMKFYRKLLICIAMVGEKVDASSLYEFQSKKCNCLDEFSGRASKSLTFIFIKALCLNSPGLCKKNTSSNIFFIL